jgi:hypothetical protein
MCVIVQLKVWSLDNHQPHDPTTKNEGKGGPRILHTPLHSISSVPNDCRHFRVSSALPMA